MADKKRPRTRSAPAAAAASALVAILVGAGTTAFAVSFHDIAAEAGIEWVHASTTDGFQNFPETNGSGACWGDVDGDGVDDLFLVNGLYADHNLTATLDPRSALYLNHGNGTFADISQAWNADLSGWGQGCAFADHDGDADLDLIVVGYDMLVLLRNDGDRFVDVTTPSGLTLQGNCDGNTHCFGETASFADYDSDGDLDVYITQYGDYDIDVGGPVSPGAVNGMSNILFANNGDGTFTDVTDIAGVRDDPGPDRSKSFQSSWADYDRDGLIDLYIASDTTPNTLFHNNGDGTFTDVATSAGVDDADASMGLVFQDINHDGLPDLFFTHFEREHNGYYLNNGDGTFEHRSGLDGLHTDYYDVGWGSSATDLDNDGRVDILAINGHTSELTGRHQEPRFYRANPNGTFTDISNDAGPAFQIASVGRGSAVADHDLDGDLDFLLLAQYNETARLIENRGGTNRFLQVELRAPHGMNRHGIGAEVTVTPAGGASLMRVIQAGNTFLGQDSNVVHAGLGDATTADVHVRWPDGTIQTFPTVPADQRVRITKDVGTLLGDTVSPMTDILFDGPTPGHGWYNGTVTVTLRSIDRAVGAASGLSLVELDPGTGWVPYTEPFEVETAGVHELRARGTDAAGHIEPARSTLLRIDNRAPHTIIELNGTQGQDGWYRDQVDGRFVGADDLAGVQRIQWRINGGAWSERTTFTVDLPGEHLIEYRAEDIAGNREEIQSLIVKVDPDPPHVHMQGGPVTAGLGGAWIHVDASDPTSHVRHVAFHVGTEDHPRHVDSDGSDGWSWRFTAPPGVYDVRAVATDAVDHHGADALTAVVLPDGDGPPMVVHAGILALVPLVGLMRLRRRLP